MLSTTQHKVRLAANTLSFIQPWTLLLAVLLTLSTGIAMGDSIDDDGDGFCDAEVCTDGSVPGDCDDTDATGTGFANWYPDCDDDNFYSWDAVFACGETGADAAAYANLVCPGATAPPGDDATDWSEGAAGPDCDDNDPFRNPDATEICDGSDNNCDGVIDEGCGSYDLYGCGGATFEDGYTAHVILEAPWMGVAFQAEDDVDGTCKDKKNDGFACTRSGNLITARIDDAAIFRDFDDSVDNYTLDLAVSAAGDPAYATVYADIFDPGDCASPFACDYDGVDQGGDSGLADDTCYDSGFGGGGSADGNGYFDSAAASCAAIFENTNEGTFAQGDPLSPDWSNNGGPSKGNWAMYVELHAACQGGLVSVPAGSTPPTCDSAAVTVDAIADGGDFDMDYIDAGDVTFAPDTDCAAELECEDSLSPTACVFDD